MYTYATADFIQKVLGVYTSSMQTIYLSLRAQVAVGNFFMKSPVYAHHFARYFTKIRYFPSIKIKNLFLKSFSNLNMFLDLAVTNKCLYRILSSHTFAQKNIDKVVANLVIG